MENEEERPDMYIKCPDCGKTFTVDVDDINDHDVMFECNSCGGEIEVSYFGYCPNCQEIVGHRYCSTASLVGNVVGNAVSGFLNPIGAIGSVLARLDNIPSASSYGYCHFCNRLYLECPECGTSVHINKDADDNDVFECPECGTCMRQP